MKKLTIIISILLCVVVCKGVQAQTLPSELVAVGDTVSLLEPSFKGAFVHAYLMIYGKKYTLDEKYLNTDQIVRKIKDKKGIIIVSQPNTPKVYEVHIEFEKAMDAKELSLKKE